MPLANRHDIYKNIAKGEGYTYLTHTLGPGSSTTGASANSGQTSLQMLLNNIGTTFPSTLVGFPGPNGASTNIQKVFSILGSSTAFACYVAYFYEIGTVNLATTGDQFTHHAATFPLLRTRWGQASQPINLLPMLQITTATATTAPSFILKTGAGGAGYVNQAGSNIVGVKTFTCPAAITAINSCYFLRLEDEDSGIRDVTQINITAAGSAGAGRIWGVELLSEVSHRYVDTPALSDNVYCGINMCDLKPAVATSGTAAAYLGVLRVGATSATNSLPIMIQGVANP